MRELGLPVEFRFAAYHQVFQELLDPTGLFASNTSGVNVVLVRFDDWPAGQASEFVDAVRAAAGRTAVPLILVLCPGALQFDDVVRRGVAGLPSVYVLTAAEIASLYPVAEVHDPHGDELGHLPYTPLFFVALATAIARKIHAIAAPPFKVDRARLRRHAVGRHLRRGWPAGVVARCRPAARSRSSWPERRRAGMLLALCSKNNEEDVVETFRAHPGNAAAPRRFRRPPHQLGAQGRATSPRSPKSWNWASTASSWWTTTPRKCTEAQAGAPEVLALPLPARRRRHPRFPAPRLGLRPRPRHRGGPPPSRAVRAARRARARRTRSAPAWKISWRRSNSRSRIAPLEPHQVARVAQLTQRTNQMNATCRRRTEAEIQALLRRRVPHRRRERPLRQLRPHRRHDLPRGRAPARWWSTRSC